jgi:hypothetical protein
VQLVLDGGEERARDVGIPVVVDAALLIDVGDLEAEATLAGADLADALQQFVEVVLAETRALLEALVVEHEAFDDEVLQRPHRPDAELSRQPAVDAVADRHDCVEIVEIGEVGLTVGGSYPGFPEN